MHNRFTFGFLFFVLLFFSARSLQAGLVFSDSFDSGASPLWGNEVGDWTSTGGIYDALSPNNSPATYSGLPFVLTDFSVEVDVNGLLDGGIWLRSTDNGNGVLLVTGGGASGNSGLYWHTVSGGTFSAPLNVVSGLFSPGNEDVHLRVDVAGDIYSVFVNGSNIAATTLTTNEFASGRVGLYDFSTQTFDNVSISAVPEPSSIGFCLISGMVALCRSRRKTVITA
jgi:hypothetical protein